MVVKTDPNRAALAEAIRERDDIARRLEAANEAVGRAADIVHAGPARLAAAKAAVAAAKDAEAERFVAGETSLMERPVREARAAEQDVADDIEAAREALARIKATIKELEQDGYYAQLRVKNAIGRVLLGAVGEVIQEAETLQDRLNGQRAILDFAELLLPADAPERRRMEGMVRAEGRPADLSNHRAPAPWRAAYDALLSDANAALPSKG
jgi:chromosome segregation ATPase